MSLTGALSGVAGYQPELGRQQPAQLHLASARQQIAAELPPIGYRIRSSGSGQSLPKVAWVAILDPDVTTTAQRGLYIVYLYDVTTQTVVLSMNQGATAHRDHYVANKPSGMSINAAALAELRAEADAIREHLSPDLLAGTSIEIELGSSLYLPRGYEAGNIAAIPYTLTALPAEQQLRSDLQRFLILYQEAVVARAAAIAADPERFSVPATPPPDGGQGSAVFRPKDAGEYSAWVAAHRQKRSRKHEQLINSFVVHAKDRGWVAATQGYHPRDLVLDKAGQHLLIEAKTVRANSQDAVREAIGQLLAYEYLYYPNGTNKVALFTGPVGDLWVELLARLSIDCVWPEGTLWRSHGSTVAWV